MAPVRASVAARAATAAMQPALTGVHAMAPCHGMGDDQRVATVDAHAATPQAPGHASGAQDDGGCCVGDSCLCDCLAQASMAHVAAMGLPAPPSRADIAFVPAPWRGPPRLPHLMRPPIG